MLSLEDIFYIASYEINVLYIAYNRTVVELDSYIEQANTAKNSYIAICFICDTVVHVPFVQISNTHIAVCYLLAHS